ncbi:MAG: GerMN domain-containing protein [Oscillospiraceae bacterium]|nr:GerMN domain-containing protein [Oscillospiraceae bacterium]
MKKLLAFSALLVTMAFVLAACGTPVSQAETTTEAPTQLVRLYIPPSADEPYVTYVYAESDGTPEDVVRLLVQHAVLPQGTYLLGVTMHASGAATLDMNEGFLQGQSQEEMLRQIDGLGFTFSVFFGGLVSVHFTAAGQEINSYAATGLR